MSKAKPRYKVVGGGKLFGVAHVTGGMEYDLLETWEEAEKICAILNRGIGPEWDAVEREL
jgi:hypothetical protein